MSQQAASAQNAAISTWEQRTLPLLVAAAILPIVQVFQDRPDWIEVLVFVLSWLVFLIDLIVHIRLKPGYLSTRFGRFDTAIVVITFPWELLFPGGTWLGTLVLVRLARLARVLVLALRGAPKLRLLTHRLGQAFLYVCILVTAAALIMVRVEPESSGFATFGDALWWAIVTLTTVGYGDLTPVTALGRIVAVIVMLVGLAFLGAIAGTLASFFGIGTKSDSDEAPAQPVLSE
jgi:voltage-gated potassium channel